MKRIAITLSLVAAFSALAYYVLTHPDLERVERLRREHRELESQNDKLAEKNEKLRRKIVALRQDPRLAERRARERSGLARPDELVVRFKDGEKKREKMHVRLEVSVDTLRLAGEDVEVDALEKALGQMHQDLPDASLTVSFDDEVGPLRKERVIDIVDHSELAPATYERAGE